jgi:hypothetical protein
MLLMTYRVQAISSMQYMGRINVDNVDWLVFIDLLVGRVYRGGGKVVLSHKVSALGDAR